MWVFGVFLGLTRSVCLQMKHSSASSMGLASPSARHLLPWTSLLIRLSWASPAFAPFLRSTPLSVHSRSVLPPPFGAPAPPAAHHVPPSWILTTSTVCSALGVRECCIPVRKGFAAFPGASPLAVCFMDPKVLAPASRAAHHRSPQRGSYPSKHSPRRQPYRITAAVALLPLSSSRTDGPYRSANLRIGS
jgi:hypothetical protein